MAAFTDHGDGLAIELPGGRAWFTTGPDVLDPAERRGVAERAGVPVERWAWGEQVHGARVRRVRSLEDLEREEPADGQVTTLRGVACVVRTADCLPVALIAPQAVGMLHAGWRGLAAGVLEEGVAAMREAGAGEMAAAIGPAAGPCCYEAGPEVHAAFAHLGPPARRGAHADLPAIAGALLGGAGVTEIHDSGRCTICSAGGVRSHRRQGEDAGRNGGLACRS